MGRALALSLILAACSGTAPAPDEDPAAAVGDDLDEHPATAVADEQVAQPADPELDPRLEPPSCEPGTASSPWSYGVADDDIDDEQCAGTTHRPGPPCTAHSDCGVCHDGSSCGRPANRAEIERLGAECCREDAAECEPFAVRCCDGHCRFTEE